MSQQQLRQHQHALPRAHQRGHQWFALLTITLWVLASLAVFGFIVQRDLSRNEREFNAYGENLQAQLRDKLRANEAVLYGFASFLGANETSEQAAASYASSVLTRYPHIYQLQIVARVARQEVPQLVAGMQRAGHGDFALRGFTAAGELRAIPVEERDFFYPVVFSAPASALSEKILGLDVGARQSVIDRLFLSEREGVAVSSETFRLLEGDLGYLMFRPVLGGKPAPGIASGPRYALLVVRAIDLVPPRKALLPDIRHTLFLRGDFAHRGDEAALFDLAATPVDRFSSALLPKLRFDREEEGFSQPVRLSLERQLRPGDFDLGALALCAIASLLSAALLFAYLRTQGQLRQQIEFLALYDTLTGLPNRHLLNNYLQKALALAQRQQAKVALLFVDLDEFKPINDRFGHAAGDALLQTVACRLKDSIRDCDVASRLGGDEFVVVLCDIRKDCDAVQVAEKIRRTLAEPASIGDKLLPLSASVGIAIFPDDGSTPEELLSAADQAMYVAKDGGKGCLGRCNPSCETPTGVGAPNLAGWTPSAQEC